MSEHRYEYPFVVEIPRVPQLLGPDDFGIFPVDKETLAALPQAVVGAVGGGYKYYAKENPAVLAWGALAAGVIAYDTWAMTTDHETMSHAYHRGIEHPVLRFGCIGMIGAVALHLGHKT